jgi:hypothetical protein
MREQPRTPRQHHFFSSPRTFVDFWKTAYGSHHGSHGTAIKHRFRKQFTPPESELQCTHEAQAA